VLAGGRSSGAAVDAQVPWVSAPDGAGLDDRLEDLGILKGDAT